MTQWAGRGVLAVVLLALGLDAGAQGSRSVVAGGTLDAVVSACAGAEICTVRVMDRWGLRLAGDAGLPANIVLRFEEGGEMGISGGALTIGSGRVEAGEGQRIFAGGSAVRGLDEARPEWFAEVGADGYPAEAMAGAYRATKVWGTIRLREATYLSPFFDPSSWLPCAGAKMSLYDSPRSFVGMGRPGVDDERDPQRLVGGTILRGEVCGVVALKAYHLGLDEGPWVVAHVFDGHPGYGFVLSHAGPVGAVKGTRLEDVSVLTNGMDSQHSVIIEGQDDAAVQGLWIWTQGGTHGLVIKSSHTTVRDFHCKGASSDCLIVKSDAATDGAGYAAEVVVDGVEISSLRVAGDTGGIGIDSRWDSVHALTMDHVTERGTSYGILGSGSLFHTMRDVTVRHWTAEVEGMCLNLTEAARVVVEEFRCQSRGAAGVGMLLKAKESTIRSGTIGCQEGCGKNGMSGIFDLGRGNRFEGVTAVGLTGYLLEDAAGAHPEVNRLAVMGTGGRVRRRYVAPPVSLGERLAGWIAVTKVNLRIVWTTLDTRLAGRLRFWVGVGLLGFAGVAMAVSWRRRWR